MCVRGLCVKSCAGGGLLYARGVLLCARGGLAGLEQGGGAGCVPEGRGVLSLV